MNIGSGGRVLSAEILKSISYCVCTPHIWAVNHNLNSNVCVCVCA